MIHMFSSLVNLKKNRGECRETNDVRRVKKRLLLPSSLGPRYPSRSLLFHFLPRGIWIVFLHCRCDPGGIFAQVFLKDFPIMINNKSHHAGVPGIYRISNDREPADHFSFYEITISTAGRILPLRRQDPVTIAVVWRRRAGRLSSVAFASCLRHDWAKRTLGLSCLYFPVHAGLYQQLRRPKTIFLSLERRRSLATPCRHCFSLPRWLL